MEQELVDLLRNEEVLGAIVFSGEGLPLASAGVPRTDAELVGALGASLLGAVDRTSRRIGAGPVETLSFGAAEGMVHLWCGDDVAVAIFTAGCDREMIQPLGVQTLERASAFTSPL
jgi:predicted regulator of Ras-like GTPase activity (Roadblock/LC7/MglB family)